MRKLALFALALFVMTTPAWTHVGSPNVFYDGNAGPYPVRVIIRPPAVIPADVEITVRLRDGQEAEKVTVQPVWFKTGLEGAPPPDEAKPVPGAPGVWSGQFLLMRDGSWSVRVHVYGPKGEGTTQVPMPAIRSQIFGMDKGLGAFLALMGLFLFAGAVSIVAAAVREASLPPGQTADGVRVSRARAIAVLTAFVLALLLWGAKNWWDSTDAQLRQKIFKPFNMRTETRLDAGRPMLALTIDDPRTQSWPPLMPDHGKLMHMFLLREPGLDAFAHLHPLAQGQKDFLTALPPLPAGTYRVYADIVDESGFPQTLVDRVEIPASGAAQAQGRVALDPDDSWRVSKPLSQAPKAAGPQVSPIENGGSMTWQQEPLAVNRETTLRFEVRGPDGNLVPLEPYMGMLGHAVINREDGEVFVHLHPMGTLNMAAQQVFEESGGGPAAADHSSMQGMDHSAMPAMDHSAHGTPGNRGVVSFPYEFPQPGRYRLWVQVKSGGQILTGVFAAEVGEE